MELRTLLIDNYDSYTYNLFQLIAEVNGALPTVLRNDEVSWPELERRIAGGEWHNIVISPGPGTPEREADVGLSLALLRAQPHIPVLGVCLGFQALALAHGGAIAHAPEPVHGRLSAIAHSGHALFEGIPSGRRYAVVRYHSLLVEEGSLPPCLEPLAWTCGGHHALQLGTDDDAAGDASSGGSSSSSSSSGGGSPGRGERLLMALAHRTLPHYGVQFHPESIATGFGAALLRNFAALTWRFHGQPLPPLPPSLASKLPGPPGSAMPPRPWEQPAGSLRVHHRHLPGLLAAAGGSEGLFWHLFGGSSRGSGNCTAEGCCSSGGRLGGSSDPQADTFWLDSATPDRGRFSFMGGRGGSLWRRVEYRLPPNAADAAAAVAGSGGSLGGPQHAAANGAAAHLGSGGGSSRPPQGTLVLTAADGSEQRITTDFFGWLQALLASHCCRVSPEDAAALPFDFWGGLVGYLGYELKAECGGRAAHVSTTPDAAFFLADQLLAVDHHTDSIYVLALFEADSTSSQQEAQQWVDRVAARVQALAAARQAGGAGDAQAPAGANGSVLQPQANGVSRVQAVRGSAEQPPATKQQQQAERPPAGAFQLREGRQRYLKNVASCMQALYDGESYEVCLTTMLSRRGSVPPAQQLYGTLRRVNPAPYAAWLRFGAGSDALQLCCCSPERFLRGGRGGLLEAKPIKGTAPRSSDPEQDARAAAELAASEKDRAENLMIVDLLRNDLGRVCEPGSVHVPALMHIESYATVHQMVSTVRGLRRPGASIVDCLRAAFPGGSMTGAPKIRTMEIIDQLEQGPRGVYSGSLGFISFNDTFDLNIVIRTAVLHGDTLSIGAGGAIVVQSDPEGEYEEMRLKARALLRAIGECDGGGGAAPAAVDEG
ncbi:hypothetical protein COHA_004364 [Chlorella ohadii]|uniref:aminodeoxychorismate synthase n=1 Tax=Chlorella ohadii TaxID=2649997 RepID=A0AAD5H6D1_9CHLO|nr:hypothetical protein COHA_004364 [Chlorella ohadii]